LSILNRYIFKSSLFGYYVEELISFLPSVNLNRLFFFTLLSLCQRFKKLFHPVKSPSIFAQKKNNLQF